MRRLGPVDIISVFAGVSTLKGKKEMKGFFEFIRFQAFWAQHSSPDAGVLRQLLNITTWVVVMPILYGLIFMGQLLWWLFMSIVGPIAVITIVTVVACQLAAMV